MTFFAWVVLFVFLAAIVLMIAAGIELALRDKNEERFEEMLEHAEIRVVQRLEIIDEMR